ncbi:MAG: hypothetical protein AAF560_07150 [Acidobacteriota bacterium]
MTFLIAQIFVCLLVCTLLGALAGWLIRDMVAAQGRRQQEETRRRELRQSEARAGTFKNQLTEARQQTENLRAELARTRAAVAQPSKESSADTKTVDALREALAERDKKIELLNLQVAQSQASVSSEWKSIKALKTELAERQSRLEARGKRLGAQWSQKLEKSEQGRRQQQDQMAALQQQNARLGEELAATKQTLHNQRERAARRLAELEKLRRQLASEPETAERQTAEPPKAIDDRVDETPSAETIVMDTAALEQAIDDATLAVDTAALEIPEIEPPEEEPSADAERDATEAAAAEPDNLEELKGIGPVLHRRLNELGVTTFRQIASWTEDDIERISSQLGAFRGRIVRDRWVEKAAERVRAQEQ